MNPVSYRGLFQVTPTKTIDETNRTDLIIVSAISGDLEKEIENNQGVYSLDKKTKD